VSSAKTVFMKCLMKLQDSYFIDGGNTTKSGMTDYVFSNKRKYLLIDEIDKMPTKDQTFLLNLIETGIVTETKHRKTRTAQMKTWVFATSNNISKVMTPMQSRFLTVKLKPYSHEQFYDLILFFHHL
jgi:MoxR-like ATPase